MVSVIALRIVIISTMYQATENIKFFKQYARLLATGLAASINAIIIEVGYKKLVLHL